MSSFDLHFYEYWLFCGPLFSIITHTNTTHGHCFRQVILKIKGNPIIRRSHVRSLKSVCQRVFVQLRLYSTVKCNPLSECWWEHAATFLYSKQIWGLCTQHNVMCVFGLRCYMSFYPALRARLHQVTSQVTTCDTSAAQIHGDVSQLRRLSQTGDGLKTGAQRSPCQSTCWRYEPWVLGPAKNCEASSLRVTACDRGRAAGSRMCHPDWKIQGNSIHPSH